MTSEEERISTVLNEVVKQVKNLTDTKKLSVYRRVFKRNVPWYVRSWVTAQLLKKAMNTGGTRPSEGTNLFFGMGKNFHIFPRDLINLLVTHGNLERDDVGDIKVLPSYSFVTVSKGKAQTVINQLNGMNYRGRKLMVNLAKKKDSPY